MYRKYLLLFWVLFLGVLGLNAQVLDPVKWSFSLNRINETQVEVVADAVIDANWHLYSTKIPDGGPVPTSLNINASEQFSINGEVQQSPEPDPFYDESFQMELGYFSEKARLTQVLDVVEGQKVIVAGYVEFMVCDDHRCLPPQSIDFELREDGVIQESVGSAETEADLNSESVVDASASSQPGGYCFLEMQIIGEEHCVMVCFMDSLLFLPM